MDMFYERSHGEISIFQVNLARVLPKLPKIGDGMKVRVSVWVWVGEC